MKKFILIITLLFSYSVSANNIRVNNISLENLNDISNWVHVEFDLAWDNSWRISSGPSNWDAAWAPTFKVNVSSFGKEYSGNLPSIIAL